MTETPGVAAAGLPSAPYRRACAFYGCYYGFMGVLVPFWGAYLHDLGMDPFEIGQLYGVLLATRILMPSLWGWIADRSGRPLQIVRIGMLLSVASLGFILVATTFWQLLFITLFFALFWNAVLPQVEAVVLRYLGPADARHYGRIRLWGSVGFVTISVAAGVLFEIGGIQLVPVAALCLMLGTAAILYSFPPVRSTVSMPVHRQSGSWSRRLSFVVIILLCVLNQAAHGPQIAFFTLYAVGLGYSETQAALLWSLSIASEVGMFAAAPFLLKHISRKHLLLAAFGGGVVRWIVLAAGSDLPLLLPVAQGFQALSFGLYHVVMIAFFQRVFGEGRQGTGQAIYSSVGFGLGGTIGAVFAGHGWSLIGPAQVFLVAAGLSLMGLLMTFLMVRNQDLGEINSPD